MRVTEAIARDIRFPTSEDLSGSDTINEVPTTQRPKWCTSPTIAYT